MRYQGNDTVFVWSEIDDRAVEIGRWREVTNDEASREFDRLFEMHDTSPSVASLKVSARGLELKVGDYYWGNVPDAEGIWARFSDDPSIVGTPNYVGVFNREHSEHISSLKDQSLWFWMYLGEVPSVGSCLKEPIALVPGEKYRIACMSNSWTYRFSGEIVSKQFCEKEIAHWFSSENGSEVQPLRRNQIIEKI